MIAPRERPRRRTRDTMVESAIALLRMRSAAGVTIDSVLAHSGAPRGSVYHHFPGGRDQLIAEAVERSGQYVLALIQDTPGSPSQMVGRLIEFWERVLRNTDHFAGCPVAALTVDVSAAGAEHDLVAQTFALWRDAVCTRLIASGLDETRASRMATLIIAATEGALLLCRAQRSVDPLIDVHLELDALLARSTTL